MVANLRERDQSHSGMPLVQWIARATARGPGVLRLTALVTVAVTDGQCHSPHNSLIIIPGPATRMLNLDVPVTVLSVPRRLSLGLRVMIKSEAKKANAIV